MRKKTLLCSVKLYFIYYFRIMKKVLVAIVSLLCSVARFGQYSSGGFELDKESLYYGIRFGGTLSSISGDIDVGSKVGLTLAGVIGLRLSSSSPVFLESGVYYTQRGAKDDDYEVTHNNLEFPVVVKYGVKATDDIALLPFVGPYFAYAVSADQKYKGVDVSKSFPRVNRWNMGFKLGCGAEYNKLYAEIGYQFGITNMLDDDKLSGHNNALFLNLGVNF